MNSDSQTYKKAGVDIEKGEKFVDWVKKLAEETYTSQVVSGIGGFSGLFKFRDGVLSCACDGVGTKLLIASLYGDFSTVGIDAVAMVVNDLLASGARPLLFLDYVATGKLNINQAKEIMRGIKKGCDLAGCVLLGGETAEMPGMYRKGGWEIVGFGVGEQVKILPGEIKEGDAILGLASSGLHSNGFSLVRKVFLSGLKKEEKKKFLHSFSPFLGKKWGEELLLPTKIYVRSVLPLIESGDIKGIAHITGGGLPGNLSRILPDGLGAEIKKDWEIPIIFKLIQEKGNIQEEEMFKVFNMGVGLALIVEKDKVREVKEFLEKKKEKTFFLGEIVLGKGVKFS